MYEKVTFDNGLRLTTSFMPHTRSVSVAVFVGAGSRYETDPEAGVSHFVEHLFFKGTEKRPTAMDISEAIEGVGGVINAGTDRELTVYWAKVAASQFDLALDVITDALLHSRFDPK
jgi:predicted Zn-dependent peptidase